jgi:prepilin peptidase CpaA
MTPARARWLSGMRDMTLATWIHLTPLLVMLVIAAAIDSRQRRIPNWLTLTIMLCGLAQSFTVIRTVGPAGACLGLLAGFALMLGQFALGGLGGGDVKLLMGVGAWVGPIPLLAIFMATSLVGLVIVVSQALYQGRMNVLLRNSAVVAVNLAHLQQVGAKHAMETGRSCRSVERPLPYAIPTLVGTILVASSRWFFPV